MQLKQMAELRKFAVQVFIHCVKALLEFLLVQLAYWVMGRVVVHIGEQDGLGEGGPDMLARAAIAVSARANLYAL